MSTDKDFIMFKKVFVLTMFVGVLLSPTGSMASSDRLEEFKQLYSKFSGVIDSSKELMLTDDSVAMKALDMLNEQQDLRGGLITEIKHGCYGYASEKDRGRTKKLIKYYGLSFTYESSSSGDKCIVSSTKVKQKHCLQIGALFLAYAKRSNSIMESIEINNELLDANDEAEHFAQACRKSDKGMWFKKGQNEITLVGISNHH